MAKSNVTIAKEVLKGLWGNGIDRKTRLRNAGYDPNVIQGLVNRLAKGEVIAEPSTDYTALGKQVEKCIKDIEGLDSFKKLSALL